MICKNTIIRIFKQKINVFMVFALPFLLTIGINWYDKIDSKIHIGIIDESNTQLSKALLNKLNENNNLNIIHTQKSTVNTDLIENKYSIVLLISKLTEDTIKNNEINNLIEIKSLRINDKLEDFEKWLYSLVKEEDISDITKKIYSNNKESKVGTSLIGFLTMFFFLEAVIFLNLFVIDKEKNTVTRFLYATKNSTYYILGVTLGCFILMLTQIILITFFAYILSVSIGFSYISLFLLLLIVISIATLFGLCIVTNSNNSYRSLMFGNVVVLLSSIVGGCIWNIQNSPSSLQIISNLTPQKRILNLSNILENNQSFSVTDLVFIIVFCLIFIIISSVSLKRFNNKYI